MTTTATDRSPTNAEIMERLDALQGMLVRLETRQAAREEMVDEVLALAKPAMRAASTKLEALEKKGWFAFGNASLEVADRIVEGFSPDDVRALGDNVVRILGTVRRFTQPAMLAIAERASDAVDVADDVKPMSLFGTLRATRDDDVRRGIAVALGVLREVGRTAERVSTARKTTRARMVDRLAPRKPVKAIAAKSQAASPRRAAPAAPEAPPATAVQTVQVHGVTFDKDGFLVDREAWNRDLAVQVARALDLPELSGDHWKVIETARVDFAERKQTPNIRRLSILAGMSTKEIYGLFPVAPGKTAARIAGLPKPAGCI